MYLCKQTLFFNKATQTERDKIAYTFNKKFEITAIDILLAISEQCFQLILSKQFYFLP